MNRAALRTLAISFNSLAESQRITFTFTQVKTEYRANFDADKIEKIVTNLLANAFKFTPAGNDVRMNVSYPESAEMPSLLVRIEDTGIGIAPEDLTHIFERFYQRSVSAQNSRTYEGTGIGLALVHELVRVLGGQVDVTSTVGQGTIFCVTLPLTRLDKPAPAQPVATDSSTLPVLQDAVFPVSSLSGEPEPEPADTERILLIIRLVRRLKMNTLRICWANPSRPSPSGRAIPGSKALPDGEGWEGSSLQK